MGAHEESLSAVNTIRERRGAAAISFLDPAVLYEETTTELYHEGAVFFLMKSLGMVDEVMPLEEYRYLLPIPQDAMEKNMNLAQNPGY